MNKNVSIEFVKEEVSRLDDSLNPDDETYKVAVILLSCAIVGPNKKAIQEFTGYKKKIVNECLTRGYDQGLFIIEDGREMISPSDWWDEESGGIAFWLDVLNLQGLVDREKA